MEQTITLPLPPSANRYWRSVRGRVVVSTAAKAYKAEAGWLLKAAGHHEPLTGDVALQVWIYRKQRKGDTDNYLKVLVDSLQGVAYIDDSQVVEIHAYRRDDKDNPRIELQIGEAEL